MSKAVAQFAKKKSGFMPAKLTKDTLTSQPLWDRWIGERLYTNQRCPHCEMPCSILLVRTGKQKLIKVNHVLDYPECPYSAIQRVT